MKKTALYEDHVKANGRIIDFGGWALPVEYKNLMEEHNAVRNNVGLFDVSHMGEITVVGKDAEKWLDSVICNNVYKMKEKQCMYTPMCYENGTIVDDLLVYKYNSEKYLLVVNASNTDKDFEWYKKNLKGDVKIENVSNKYSQIAIQGPNAEKVLEKLTKVNLSEIKFYWFEEGSVDCAGEQVPAIISRTGYTGEPGFEIYCEWANGSKIWNALMKAGEPMGIIPCGLGARDTLRFEACLVLYGHEISDKITPIEAKLDWAINLLGADFVGKKAIVDQKEKGLSRISVGLELLEPGIARQDYEVCNLAGDKIGYVTTGTMSPTFKKSIALALIETKYAALDSEVMVKIRNKLCKAKVVTTPFYKHRRK